MRCRQLPANLPFQRRQHLHIRLRIQTPHPPPISREPHFRKSAAVRASLNHHHPNIDKLIFPRVRKTPAVRPSLNHHQPNIDELILHRVRNIPQQEKLKLFSFSHQALKKSFSVTPCLRGGCLLNVPSTPETAFAPKLETPQSTPVPQPAA